MSLQSPTPRVSGFTLVRNAQILDFPFFESVESLLPLVDELVINCGDSQDETQLICKSLAEKHVGKIHILNTVWENKNQTGGFQLKAQSDAAMKACRGQWLFYIQADEVLHENDYPQIQTAMAYADEIPEVDGLVFDYLHFYGNYAYTCKGRNWYRREVRAFKNGRGIESFRDAQGFRKGGQRLQALPSQARVFHYGYVRPLASLKTKKQEMSQWWGETPPTETSEVTLSRPIGLTPFRETHPHTMSKKISNNKILVDPSRCPRRWNAQEIKNALTLFWEKLVPIRLGEYRNYELLTRHKD